MIIKTSPKDNERSFLKCILNVEVGDSLPFSSTEPKAIMQAASRPRRSVLYVAELPKLFSQL
jgi:hypothetical protein